MKGSEEQGTSEDMGLRSTRPATLCSSLIPLPGTNLIEAAADDLGACADCGWSTWLGAGYERPPELVAVDCEGVRELARRHSCTRIDCFQIESSESAAAPADDGREVDGA